MIRLKLVLTLSILSFIQICDLHTYTARADTPLGIFENHADIGNPALPGGLHYDDKRQTYLVTGGGKNMWFDHDSFQFVWKQMSGDVSLAATVRWPSPGKEPHRKACLIIRQSLDSDSVYVDAALHGDGLTSLQYREVRGEQTYEIQSNTSRPARIRLEKQGDRVFMSVAAAGQPLRHAGGSFKIHFQEPFYVGLGVCAHNDAVVEKAEFTDVELKNDKFEPAKKPLVESTLEVVDIGSKDRRVIYHTAGVIEAPNWTPDGKSLLFNSKGHIYRIPSTGGEPQLVDTGVADRCNNDHGISPDGKNLAISHHGPGGKSLIYIVPLSGGVPKQITAIGPSYWHGWSPDGLTLVYCAERNGEFDVYSIPAAGGDEKRLTTSPGLDDGPEYSPDGKYIYFNSVRSGHMQIWRMRPDGSDQEQVTKDEFNNWFPHISPDGRWLVFLSYEKGVEGHPPNKEVQLRLLEHSGGRTPPEPRGHIEVIAKLFGGQGTINVPSWAPSSHRIAFVSYMLVNPDNSGQSVQDLLKKTADFLAEGNYQDALQSAQKAIELDSKNSHAHFLRGVANEGLQHQKVAIQDFDKTLELDPKATDAYDHRGSEHFKLGHIQESIQDFDKFLELHPAAKPGHWKRGISLYYAGRFEEGRKQFEGYQTVDNNDVENAVWRFLCQAHEVGIEKARADLMKIGKDRRVPLMEIYALFAGQAKPEDVLAATGKGQPPEKEMQMRMFYAHLYLGLYEDVIGNKTKALEHLKAAEQLPVGGYMWDVARVHRAVLEKNR
jgi:Tol biopolymer transport system component/lipoprotein NlpI